MIELNTITTLLGLVGVTIVLSSGKIFDGLRSWLVGFKVRWNPLRFLGEVMSCTMCMGWWIGFLWGTAAAQGLGSSVVFGGLVSVASFAADEALTILAAYGIRAARALRPAPQPMAPPPPPPVAPRAPEDEAPITEDEAHQIADRDDQ